MFRSLQIENFQSHENTKLEFDPGVNVIFGLSQSGKTATMRALRLVTENRPLGGRYFSDFAGEQGQTKVVLTLNDGNEIELCKTIKNKDGEKSVVKGHYRLNDQQFSAADVPDQIRAALNLSELNIQRQFDAPFLIMSSPGEIAKTINRITKLEEVDEWISALTSNINQSNRDIIRMEGEAKSLTQELEVYKDIDKTEKIIGELRGVDLSVTSLQSQTLSLDKMLEEFKVREKSYEEIKEFLLAERYVLKAEKIQIEIDNYEKLRGMLDEYSNSFDFVRASNNRRTALTKIDLELKESEYTTDGFDTLKRVIESLEIATNKFRKLRRLLIVDDLIIEADKLHSDIQLFDSLNGLLTKINSIQANRADIEKNKQDARTKYMDILVKTKQCPVCFATMDEKHIARVEDSL